eukprot:TRINITY_DN13619_c0_g1_i1.p1 TRINITY_DN13619_c0_g1~~TRINITY_DN13619_c0_g1_i1.p1  ORF type:complete len:150 (-),score=5.07 TRINITY_DN13619_c0_g1_i1:289-738(-)
MSLFVGNISRNVKTHDLEDEFEKIGKCSVNHKGNYAFVEYQDPKEAEDALTQLKGKNLGGLEITVEWSKKSGRFDSKDSRRPPRQRIKTKKFSRASHSDVKCFNCNKMGHFARECTERRYCLFQLIPNTSPTLILLDHWVPGLSSFIYA